MLSLYRYGALDLEDARVLVEQEDAERPVIDETPREDRNPFEHFVELEDRRDLVADLCQRLERRRILPLAVEQPRVLERHRDVRAELPQNRFIALGVERDLRAQQIERSDHALLPPQRHHQLRTDAGYDAHIALVLQHVVHQDRLADGDGCADQTLAHFDPQRPPHLLRVADGVRQPQVFALLIEQINGEGLEGRQARDELRDLLEQLLQVEDGRDFPTELEQSQQQARRFPELGLGGRPMRRSRLGHGTITGLYLTLFGRFGGAPVGVLPRPALTNG